MLLCKHCVSLLVDIIHYYNLLWQIGLFLCYCFKYPMLIYDIPYIILSYLSYSNLYLKLL
jgi:hypothetical protein